MGKVWFCKECGATCETKPHEKYRNAYYSPDLDCGCSSVYYSIEDEEDIKSGKVRKGIRDSFLSIVNCDQTIGGKMIYDTMLYQIDEEDSIHVTMMKREDGSILAQVESTDSSSKTQVIYNEAELNKIIKFYQSFASEVARVKILPSNIRQAVDEDRSA